MVAAGRIRSRRGAAPPPPRSYLGMGARGSLRLLRQLRRLLRRSLHNPVVLLVQLLSGEGFDPVRHTRPFPLPRDPSLVWRGGGGLLAVDAHLVGWPATPSRYGVLTPPPSYSKYEFWRRPWSCSGGSPVAAASCSAPPGRRGELASSPRRSPSQVRSGFGLDGHGPAPPPVSMTGRRPHWRGSGPVVLRGLRLLPASLARRRPDSFGPGGPDLRSSPDPGPSTSPAAVASPVSSLSPPDHPTPPTSVTRSPSRQICSSRIQQRPMLSSAMGVAPLPVMAVPTRDSTSSSLKSTPAVWVCSDYGQGEIPARLADAGSGDTCGCHPLLGGAVMAFICAPLRASGETLGPFIRTGRRQCLDVVPLREGAVLFSRGVPGGGVGNAV